MGSWRGASPNFIMPSKVGAEECQEKPQKMPGESKQGPACQSFRTGAGEHSLHRGLGGRARPAFKSPFKQTLGLQPTLAMSSPSQQKKQNS